MGVWIETKILNAYKRKQKSHPTWVCGLKHIRNARSTILAPSHPTWVCGLKHNYAGMIDLPCTVTPYVGVWIETRKWQARRTIQTVTPYVGVWIETGYYFILHLLSVVTPYVGVWIETKSCTFASNINDGHTLRGCVD